MKNYYEILEVDIHASQEVIEKAYKALVKKYHPDLQPEDKKTLYESKIKMINEAYDILSNAHKRYNYDIQLLEQKRNEENIKYNQHYNDSIKTQNQNISQNQSIDKRKIRTPNASHNTIIKNTIQNNDYQKTIKDAYQTAYQNAYHDAYIKTLKNLGYKIEYQKTFIDYLRNFIAIILTIIFIVLLGIITWHIPFTKNYLVNLYNNNDIIRALVDIIHKTLSNL